MSAMLGDKKKILFLLISILVLVIGALLPCPEGLSFGGKMTLFLLVFIFIMWIGDVMPKSISSIAAIIMLPFFGAAQSLNVVYSGFINSIFFFLLAVFGLAVVIGKSDIPTRLMILFVNMFGNDSKKLILAFSATAWIVSAFMSDLAACAMVAGIAITLSQEIKFPKKFLRCLMISIPCGSMTGGVLMPISSATNATIMQLLQQTTGTTVNFLQWMIVGVPVGIIGLLLSWILIVIVHKPEKLDDECMAALHENFKSLGPLSVYDKKTLALVGGMLVLWVAGSWIKVFDSTFVALIGLIVMFLPKMDLLSFSDYERGVPWDLLLMLGAMFSLCACMVSTGAINWIIDSFLGNTTAMNPTVFFAAMSIVMIIIRACIPNGAPVVVMVAPALLAVGTTIGVDPMLLLVGLSTWCQMTFLLPIIDAQWLMTYRNGDYTIGDVVKFGIPLSILLVIVFTIIVPPLASFSYIVV